MFLIVHHQRHNFFKTCVMQLVLFWRNLDFLHILLIGSEIEIYVSPSRWMDRFSYRIRLSQFITRCILYRPITTQLRRKSLMYLFFPRSFEHDLLCLNANQILFKFRSGAFSQRLRLRLQAWLGDRGSRLRIWQKSQSWHFLRRIILRIRPSKRSRLVKFEDVVSSSPLFRNY